MPGHPKSPKRGTATKVVLPPAVPRTPAISSDPNLLLDAFDTFTANNRHSTTTAGSTSASQTTAAAPTASSANKPTTAAIPKKTPDPIDFLNKHYTSEALLVAQLPLIRDAVTDRMNRLDDKISSALQRQSESADATQQHVQDAKASVASLEQRIRQVQIKASQSEKTVREITKDMKRLDLAKRHLQSTITTLKRLHMLIHAVEQLRLACLVKPYPDYKTASHLVDAIRLLLRHFQAYQDKVEPIRLLSQKVLDLHGELKVCLIRGFRIVGFGADITLSMETADKGKASSAASKYTSMQILEDGEVGLPDVAMPPEVMADGVLLIHALGKESRNEFITVFGQDQLAEYTKIYKPFVKKKEVKETKRVSSFKAQPEPATPREDLKPEFGLEFVEKRFLWFRKLLDQIGEDYPAVFPNYWNIEYLLAKTFLKRTRGHLLALLNGPTKDPEANNATVLLKALQKTIQFEKEVSGALQREYGTIFTDPAKESEEAKAKANNDEDESVESAYDEGMTSTTQDAVAPLLGLASSAFDNYMGPYIALEEQSMDEQLVVALEDRAVDTRGELAVFTTSTKLFIYIKGSITRCTALTKGNAFFLLYRAFQDSLRKYSQVLSSKLPPPLQQKTTGLNLPNVNFSKQDGRNAQEASYRVPKGEEVTVCHVIGTCEYCADTVEALEDLIRDTVDEQYKEKIDMMGQQEAFHDITAKAIRVLVSGLETRLEEPLRMMTNTNWALFEEVGEESDYIRYMQREIQPYITTSRGLIPTSYFRSVCDKFAMAFTNLLYVTIIRLKTISEPGSQQLLLDVSILKTLFLKLPVMEAASPQHHAASSGSGMKSSSRKAVGSGTTIAPAMYTKMVQRQFKKIEILLKLTGTPTALLIDVFRDQWPNGKPADLQTVMSLKGLKRNEQAAMLEKFGLDPATARKGATMNINSATIVSERLQAVQGQAGKVNQEMRQKVDEFRRAFR